MLNNKYKKKKTRKKTKKYIISPIRHKNIERFMFFTLENWSDSYCYCLLSCIGILVSFLMVSKSISNQKQVSFIENLVTSKGTYLK